MRQRVAAFLTAHSYVLLSTVIVLAMTGWTLNEAWPSPDFWVHLGAVREFAGAPLSPANPLVTGHAADPYMSPYTFLLGVLSSALGVDAVSVLAAAGVISLVVLLYALHRFVGAVSVEPSAPVFALVFTLTAWGWNPWRWSGFFDLNSLGAVLPLASTLASGLGLIAIVGSTAWLRDGRRRGLVTAAVCAPLVLLCHPMTAVWVGAVGAAFVAAELPRANGGRALSLIAALAAASALAAAWPFYSVVRLLGHASAFDTSNAAMYHAVLQRTFLALPGFVILGLRFRRCYRDPLAVAAALTGLLYVSGFVLGHEALGRVLPGLLLMAHVAMAAWIAELVARRDTRNPLTAYASVGVAAIIAVGLLGCLSGVVRTVPRALLPARYSHDRRLASLTAPYRPAARLIHRDDVVVASRALALGVAGSSGKLIAPAAPAPFVNDIRDRARVVAALLSPRTPGGEYRALLDRYCVKWFVVTHSEAQHLLARVDARSVLLMRDETKTMVIFEVRGSSNDARSRC